MTELPIPVRRGLEKVHLLDFMPVRTVRNYGIQIPVKVGNLLCNGDIQKN